jgi:NADPH-dependent 2,4-dienoyl-CoA reductase/sulfur reductase-like enzyme
VNDGSVGAGAIPDAAWDAVVIGAGPAGLAAAARLAEGGARILLLDEQESPGGQIYRRVERAGERAAVGEILGADYGRGAALAARMRRSGADYWPATGVWYVTPDREIWLTRAGHSQRLRAQLVIVAAGAMERPVPVPGWTLPGTMTAGAVQILLKSSGLVPVGQRRLVLAGSGPLLYLLARQLVAAGAPPAALLDTTSPANKRAALRHLPRALGREARRALAKGLALKAAIRRAGVPVVNGVTDLRIEGGDRVEAVFYTARRRSHRIPAALVALHEGVIPAQQIARSIGCEHRWDRQQQCFRPVLDEWGNSSVEGVLVAGDGGGIGGALAAEHAGTLAALAALHRLGRIDAAERDRLAAPERRAHDAQMAIRPFLDRLYAPRAEILRPADGVIVCRCEEITAGEIREVVRSGCQGPNQAKSFLRCGMGPCQGRLCGPLVSQIIAAESRRSLDETGYFRVRPPIKPVTIGELAGVDAARDAAGDGEG